MAEVHMHMPHFERLSTFARSHTSVWKMFLLYAVPLSLVPPAMMIYAGGAYSEVLSPLVNDAQLMTIAVLFFVAELVMTFLVAYVIQQLGDVIDFRPAYEDAYKLAVIAPTPLWLSPLFLFVPSLIFNVTIVAAALMLSGMLIYYTVPSILRIEEKGHAILMSGSILSAGTVAWAMMMYFVLLTWSMITSNPML